MSTVEPTHAELQSITPASAIITRGIRSVHRGMLVGLRLARAISRRDLARVMVNIGDLRRLG